jgi:CheY-like chemotaxis protein/HPt (histidine-containing phosphotransfer) domain-containing protein
VVLDAGVYPQFSADTVRRVTAMDRLVAAAALAHHPADAVAELDKALYHAHSIKGTAAVLGCHDLAELAAAAERTLQCATKRPGGNHTRMATDLRRGFRTMLSAAEAVARMDAADVAAALRPAPAEHPQHVVLHIEDAAVVVEFMRALLSDREDVDLRSAATARESLELIHSLDPSLIFLDMHLPDGSGEEVLRAILADPGTSGIPVVVVSGDDSTADAARLTGAGAVAYITKPFSVDTVLNLVDRYCGSSP